jgi:hypothetical protein
MINSLIWWTVSPLVNSKRAGEAGFWLLMTVQCPNCTKAGESNSTSNNKKESML